MQLRKHKVCQETALKNQDESFLCTVLVNHCMTMNKGNVGCPALINSTEKGKAVGNRKLSEEVLTAEQTATGALQQLSSKKQHTGFYLLPMHLIPGQSWRCLKGESYGKTLSWLPEVSHHNFRGQLFFITTMKCLKESRDATLNCKKPVCFIK